MQQENEVVGLESDLRGPCGRQLLSQLSASPSPTAPAQTAGISPLELA